MKSNRTTPLYANPWTSHILILAITLIAAAIRLYKLFDWPFYGDEAAIQFHLHVGTAHLVASFASYFPFILVHKLFPDDYILLRLVTLFWGVVTIPVVFYIAKRELGLFGAMVTALLLTLSHWHIAHSQFVKHYAEQGLFAFIAVYSAYRTIENNSRGYFVLAVIFGVLLAFVRASSLYVNAAIAGYVVLLLVFAELRPEAFERRRAILLLAIHLFVCVLAYSMKKLLYGEGDEVWGHSFLNVLMSAAFYTTVPTLAVAAVSGFVGAVRRNRLVTIMACYVFGTILMLGATAWLFSAVGGVAFMTIPGSAFLVGWIASQVWEREDLMLKGVALAIVLAVLGSQAERDFEYFTSANGNRPQVHGVFDYLSQNVRPGDTVFENTAIPFPLTFPPAREGVEIIRFLGAHGLPVEFDRTKKTWFVLEDIYSMWRVRDPARVWLDDHAILKAAFPAFIGPRSRTIWIFLYEPPSDSTSAEPEQPPID